MDKDAQMYEFTMEYALTKACLPCRVCAAYFEDRQNVLKPEILKLAETLNEEPVNVLVRFRNRYHKHHTDEHQQVS